MAEQSSELRCAELINQAQGMMGMPGIHGGIVLADPDRYTDDEVRIANESIERMGLPVKVLAGRVTTTLFGTRGT